MVTVPAVSIEFPESGDPGGPLSIRWLNQLRTPRSEALLSMTHATRSQRLKPGVHVTHLTHGAGRILAEWGALEFHDGARIASAAGKGVYDVVFGIQPHQFLHCCRAEFAHKPIDGSNSSFDFTAAEDSCSMGIPGCQVGPGTHVEVLMLDVGRAIGRQRQRRLFSAAGLNTGLFVWGDDVFIGTQWSALPDTLVKIEDGSGFCGKVRIAGKDPASMFPGAKGIAAEPAPQSSAADLSAREGSV